DNPKGLFLERWRHTAGCRRWFNMARDTAAEAAAKPAKPARNQRSGS
ncbi:MAG: sarcosine oxidase subunit delta, partial [SAR116 cluster bacterium MED-G06]